jgi:hypothetical protein
MSELRLVSPPAIVRPADGVLIELDARVDRAEDDGIRARWEFGRELLRERVGRKLPAGRLDQLAARTGKSRTELQYRVRFAERYPDENALRNAIAQYRSWFRVVNEALGGSQLAPPVIAPPALPGTFQVIYADPPWQYEVPGGLTPRRRAVERHYPTMSDEEIAAEIADRATVRIADDAVCFLWATNPKLPSALGVLAAWSRTTPAWASTSGASTSSC